MPWLDDPVSREAQELAAQSSLAHRVFWCVRNLESDQKEVARLHQRWADGQNPGPDLPTSRLRDQTDVPERYRSRPAPGLLALARNPASTQILDANPHDEGDQAYAGGDLPRAYMLYSAKVADDPRDPRAWAGLALTLTRQRPSRDLGVLRERAEILAQLYALAVSGGARCEVRELVDWLDHDRND